MSREGKNITAIVLWYNKHHELPVLAVKHGVAMVMLLQFSFPCVNIRKIAVQFSVAAGIGVKLVSWSVLIIG